MSDRENKNLRTELYEMLTPEAKRSGVDPEFLGYVVGRVGAFIATREAESGHPTNTSKVTRFEVINHYNDNGGRELVKWHSDLKVELSFQDDDRTLKVFLSKREEGNENE